MNTVVFYILLPTIKDPKNVDTSINLRESAEQLSTLHNAPVETFRRQDLVMSIASSPIKSKPDQGLSTLVKPVFPNVDCIGRNLEN